ncbi:hypothetical protein [Halegenticoccus tardaugens]|uniref:hypothetical protein n=1 Tax=Halegenticoccus tardaugens TaxID=2071624 RepID=UPI00100B4F34|nr:hypothetical protein [Halegenticoccus tardaugens]
MSSETKECVRSKREAEIAWQLYLDRGVILPGHADVIADRRLRIAPRGEDETTSRRERPSAPAESDRTARRFR